MSCVDVNTDTNPSHVKEEEETLEETALASLEKLREANDEQKQVPSDEDNRSEDDDDVADTKNSTRDLNSCDSEEENDERSNGVKSEMDCSMETSEPNREEEEGEDMDMEGVDAL